LILIGRRKCGNDSPIYSLTNKKRGSLKKVSVRSTVKVPLQKKEMSETKMHYLSILEKLVKVTQKTQPPKKKRHPPEKREHQKKEDKKPTPQTSGNKVYRQQATLITILSWEDPSPKVARGKHRTATRSRFTGGTIHNKKRIVNTWQQGARSGPSIEI